MKTSKKIEKLNGLVQKNLSSGKNMEGFLLGKVKEYATILDTENFNLRIDLDRELWLAQIQNAKETQAQSQRIERYLEGCKTEVAKIMKPQGLMPQA